MEFELLHLPDAPSGPFEALRRYLVNPRRQMQVWGDKAPVLLGVMVLFAVGIEVAVAQRIASGTGFSADIFAHVARFVVGFMLAELLVIGVASSVASVFEKVGRPLAAFTYMNLELMPLLLWLPVTLLAQALGGADGLRVFLGVALALRIFSRWRDVVQLAFRLTRLQTWAAVYGTITAVGTLVAVLFYITLLGGVLSMLVG